LSRRNANYISELKVKRIKERANFAAVIFSPSGKSRRFVQRFIRRRGASEESGQRSMGKSEEGERERERKEAHRVTFKTALRNLSDLVYFCHYRCHARSVTVALNQRHELSRGLRSRKAVYVTRENVSDSRLQSSSSMLSHSVDRFAIYRYYANRFLMPRNRAIFRENMAKMRKFLPLSNIFI